MLGQSRRVQLVEHIRGIARLVLIALAVALAMVLVPQRALAQATHALPTVYRPAQNAVLAAPPAQVQIIFSEHLNPDVSKIIVVNPSNQEVDNRDVSISADDLALQVSLPLLPAGTYVVAWRSHSADDGHIAAGSYIFHVTRADGTVPALTGALPSGNIVGGAGSAQLNPLSLPNLVAAVAHWAALLALTLLLGMIFWWRFVVSRQGEQSVELHASMLLRTRLAAEFAFEGILAATVVEVAAQAVLLDGTARGVTSLPLLGRILFQSRFGQFMLVRAGLSIIGLAALWAPAVQRSLTSRNQARLTMLFALALMLAFVYSGHGGAAPPPAPTVPLFTALHLAAVIGPSIDMLHVLANGVWLGGLLTLALIVVPALERRDSDERLGYLATALPVFGVAALMAVVLITITGPLNASARMTGFAQLWTTGYGIILTVKIGLFLVMMGISYLHAFRMRPQLARQLARMPAAPRLAQVPIVGWVETQLLAFERRQPGASHGTLALAGTPPTVATPAGDQGADARGRTIMHLMRAEAAIGAGVLLCAALLSPFAGTLAPTTTNTGSFGATGGTQHFSQATDNLTIKFTIAPGRFGSNDCTAVITNPDGTLASGGTVFVVINMVEMDMGTNEFDFTAASAPGTYRGQVDLPMAGHWQVTLKVRTLQDPSTYHQTTFVVSAGY